MIDSFLYQRCLTAAEKINNLLLVTITADIRSEVMRNRQLLVESLPLLIASSLDVTIIEKAIRRASFIVKLRITNGKQ